MSSHNVSPEDPSSTGAPAATQRTANKELIGRTTSPIDPAAAGQQQNPLGPKIPFEELCEKPELFNYLDTNNFGNSYDEHTTTILGTLRSMVKDSYVPDTLAYSGPYRAICIQIVDDGTGLQAGPEAAEPGSPEFLLNKYTDLKIEPRVRIRARVPGIDTYPVPRGALSGQPTLAQQDVIAMHTVFTAHQLGQQPKVGELVYVDWRYKPEKGPWKDPIYLGRVNDMSGISPESMTQAVAEFNKNCAGGFGTLKGSLGPSGGAPLSIPKDVKFSPTGIVVPPQAWIVEKARYIYYLYDKQIHANPGNLKQIKAYWLQGPTMTMAGMPNSKDAAYQYSAYLRMAKLTIWAAHNSGLGVDKAWIVWGTLKGECRFKPIGVLGSNPNSAIELNNDTGYGTGQYIISRYNGRLRTSSTATSDTIFMKNGGWKHEDLLDPYISIYSMCLSYKRLIKRMKGSPTVESLGAWWACPGSIKKTGAAFEAACPKGARKSKHIQHYGKFIDTLIQSAPLAQTLAEAKQLIDGRPIPTFPTYETWVAGKELQQQQSKDLNIPVEFLGTTKSGKPFDTRTKKTHDGSTVKETSPGVWEVISDSSDSASEAEDTTKPAPATPQGEQKAQYKPLKDISSTSGAQATSWAIGAQAAAGQQAGGQVPTVAQPWHLRALCSTLDSVGGSKPGTASDGPVTKGVVMGKPPAPGVGRPQPGALAAAHKAILDRANGGWAHTGGIGPGGGKRGWKGNCLAFAAKLCLQAGSPLVRPRKNKFKCNAQIQAYLKVIKTADGHYFGAGCTMAELAQQPGMLPGMVVHVKMGWHKKSAYHIVDDGHHWFVYDGNGKFWDSHHTPGIPKPAVKCDGYIKGWASSSYKRGIWKEANAGLPKWIPMLKHWNLGPRRGKRMFVHAVYKAF